MGAELACLRQPVAAIDLPQRTFPIGLKDARSRRREDNRCTRLDRTAGVETPSPIGEPELIDLGTQAVGDAEGAVPVLRPGDALAPQLGLAQLEVCRDTSRDPALAEVLPIGPVEGERSSAAFGAIGAVQVAGSLK